MNDGERRSRLLPEVPRWPADPARPVIQLRGVQKAFDGHRILRGVDLDIATGLTTVICGRSGSGKSVLLKLMTGLLFPDAGEVRLFGEDTRALSVRALAAHIKRLSVLFQSYALLDSLTVEDNVAFPLRENTRMHPRTIRPIVAELLELLDLEDAARKMPAELSGGMKKRASLARALVTQPEVVLFDEPTTGLDPILIERVDAMLVAARERFQITSVVVSHDMTSALHLADRIAVLDGGRIVAYGTPEEVAAAPQRLVRVFFDGVQGRLQRGEQALPVPAATDDDDKPVIRLRQVRKRFGEYEVLRGVDLDVPRRRITVVIGGSGSGKSVIMKHVIGLLRADAGDVEVLGEDVSRLDERALLRLRARIGMLFQSGALLDSLTVAENVAFPLRESGHPRREVQRRTQEILEQLRLADLSGRHPAAISVGQRKRVGLARAIVTRPEIVIYDEPTTGQDPALTRTVDDMIVEAQELFDITSLVVSHDMRSTFRIAHHVAMLHEGRIVASGTPEAVRSSPDPIVRRFIFAGTEEGERAARELESTAT